MDKGSSSFLNYSLFLFPLMWLVLFLIHSHFYMHF